MIDAVAYSLTMGLRPFPYQTGVLLDNSQKIVFVSGRQVGKSTVIAMKALYEAVKKKHGRKFKILIISPSERQSRNLFQKLTEICMHPIMGRLKKRTTATELEFGSNAVVYSLPSGTDAATIRGYDADIIIVDEGAYVPEQVYHAVEPSLAAKDGALWILGTPAGKIGRMWEAWNDPTFSVHHARSVDSPLITQEFIEGQRKVLPRVVFRQEYLGEFSEEIDQLYSASVIKPLMILEGTDIKREEGEYFLGVDIARLGLDETAFAIVWSGDGGETFELHNIIFVQKTRITEVMGRIRELDSIYHFTNITIDATGQGGGVEDLAIEQGVPVRGFNFGSKDREDLYLNLLNLMEQKKILLINERKIFLQFTSLRREYRADGRLKVVKSEYGHDDAVDAVALAVWKAQNTAGVVESWI